MKKVILGVLLLLSTAAYAESDYNMAIKECLYKNGYVPGETDVRTFKFSGFAGKCVNKKHIELEKARYAKEREWLKQNPHYTGSNFKWEDKAEYFCERIYSTTMSNTITVCHKPIFIN
jgi:hypothetical protein